MIRVHEYSIVNNGGCCCCSKYNSSCTQYLLVVFSTAAAVVVTTAVAILNTELQVLGYWYLVYQPGIRVLHLRTAKMILRTRYKDTREMFDHTLAGFESNTRGR